MHQFQEMRCGTQFPQTLDHPEAKPAAAMHGHAGGLVEHQQIVVLEQNPLLQPGPHQAGGNRRRLPFRQSQRWNPQAVAGSQPVLRPHPSAVTAHLAGAENAVNVGLGHPLEMGEQEIVDALAGVIRTDVQPLHGGTGGGFVHCCGWEWGIRGSAGMFVKRGEKSRLVCFRGFAIN